MIIIAIQLTFLFLVPFIFILPSYRFKKSGFNTNFLALDNCEIIRGAAQLCVVWHHWMSAPVLGMKSESLPIFGLWVENDITGSVGAIFVGIFFFLSAYGITKKANSDESYMQSFLRKRVMPMSLLYISFTLIYVALGYLFNISICTNSVQALLQNPLYLPNWAILWDSWFVLCLILFYLFFYIGMRRGKVLCYLIIFILLNCILTGLRTYWCTPLLCLILGYFFALKERSWMHFIIKHYAVMCASCVALIIVVALTPVNSLLNRVLYCFLWILLQLKFERSSKLLVLIGKYSLGIYLVHSFVHNFLLLHLGISLTCENLLAYYCVACLAVIPLAYLVQRYKIFCNRVVDYAYSNKG